MRGKGSYLLIGVLVAAVIGLGAYIYREETKPGVDVNLGNSRLTIEQR
jgi:hypothetical protein